MKSHIEKTLDLLFEMTGEFWQFGVVSSMILYVATIVSLFWAHGHVTAALESTNPIMAVLKYLVIPVYLVPLLLAFLCYLFSRKTYFLYLEQTKS